MTDDPSYVRQGVTHKVVTDDYEGQRLDNYLARELRGVPRSLIYRIMRRGEVRVNGGRAGAGYKLVTGDEIRIPPVRVSTSASIVPSSGLSLLEDLRERVLYEDDWLLVVDKPAGLAAHGGSGIEFGLIEALRALRPENRLLELVHRLDRETSGCLIVAKRRSALRALHEQFRQRWVRKTYLTLVAGRWDRNTRLVEAPLLRNQLRSGERMVQVNYAAGQVAATGFEVAEYLDGATLVRAMPHTGRTHQIRVHCAYLRHPVAGDEKYGSRDFNARLADLGLRRMFLHAEKVSFAHPESGKTMKIQAPLPAALQQVVTLLRRAVPEQAGSPQSGES